MRGAGAWPDGDDLGVATPLPALIEKDPDQRWKSLAGIVGSRGVTDMVLGHPLNMDGTAGFMAERVEVFARRLAPTSACRSI